MQSHPRLTALGLGLAFILATGVTPARAGFDVTVIGSATSLGNGLTLYSYTITDKPTSTEDVGEFSLAVPTDANLMAFSTPSQYIVDYTAGNVILAFESPAAANDLMPGSSETFGFMSSDSPGQASYTLTNYDDFNTFGGLIVAPVSVPEPGSLVLIGLGLPLAGAMLARRRPRKAAFSPARPS